MNECLRGSIMELEIDGLYIMEDKYPVKELVVHAPMLMCIHSEKRRTKIGQVEWGYRKSWTFL